MKRLLRQALDHGGVGGELGAIIKRSEIGGRGSGAPRTAFESAGEQPVGHFRILRKQRPVGIGAHNVLVARALHAIVIVVAVAAGGHDAAEAFHAFAQVSAAGVVLVAHHRMGRPGGIPAPCCR